ncbi:MAG: hypothetical protein ACTSQA_06045 [Candidatus Heimdallarchaeaceae archaeon]
MTKTNKFYDRHFFLYAKYHYEQENILDDTVALQAQYTGSLPEASLLRPALEKLHTLVFEKFILEKDCNQTLRYKTVMAGLAGKEMRATLSFLYSCLAMVKVANLPDLGKPDPNVLPLKK